MKRLSFVLLPLLFAACATTPPPAEPPAVPTTNEFVLDVGGGATIFYRVLGDRGPFVLALWDESWAIWSRSPTPDTGSS